MSSAHPPQAKILLPTDAINAFCRKWQIKRLSLFGSVLRDDFDDDSDVDVLVDFDEGVQIRFVDLLDMEDELAAILGRRVDLGTRKSVEEDANYIRRRAILTSAQDVYVER